MQLESHPYWSKRMLGQDNIQALKQDRTSCYRAIINDAGSYCFCADYFYITYSSYTTANLATMTILTLSIHI